MKWLRVWQKYYNAIYDGGRQNVPLLFDLIGTYSVQYKSQILLKPASSQKLSKEPTNWQANSFYRYLRCIILNITCLKFLEKIRMTKCPPFWLGMCSKPRDELGYVNSAQIPLYLLKRYDQEKLISRKNDSNSNAN